MARVIYLEDAVETFINGPSKIDKDEKDRTERDKQIVQEYKERKK